MKVKHSFQSAKADGGDSSLVKPSNWNAEHSLDGVFPHIRQTVLFGATDSLTGQSTFLGVGAGLSVNLQGADVYPLTVAFANGFDANGPVDYIGRVASNLTSAWASLPPNTTRYLYIDRNPSTGDLTYGGSGLAPVYALVTPSSPAPDQHWFDLTQMKMKWWSGSAWWEFQRVFVGECVTGASSVTSVTVYALCGRYDSGWFSVAALTDYAKNHNIGMDINSCPPLRIDSLWARKLDGSGPVIDVANSSIHVAPNNYGAGVRFTGRNTVTVHATGMPYNDRDVLAGTAAQFRMTLSRGW